MSWESPTVATVTAESTDYHANLEEVTGVAPATRDSHKSKFARMPINHLIGDIGGIFPVGCPLRREPVNESSTMETA